MERLEVATMPKTILFVTGTRADFGKLKPLISRVAASEDFEHRIFATGMHMLSRYGSTVEEIAANFQNIYPYLNQDPFGSTGMDLALANTIQGLGHYVREFSTDLIIVHGDRIEALAGATVGALQNILVAHIEGGEVSGTVDELLRHAISKLSHLHFVANEEARQRLVQMGEQPGSVFVTGSPDIDVMLSSSLPPLDEVKRHYEIPFDDYCIFMYHPVTTEVAGLEARAGRMWASLLASNRNFVVIHPNNDSGSEILRRELAQHVGSPRVRALPSMRFESFLSLLKHAQAIVGNSSAGVREAPVYGIPTINIGTRQLNRFTHASIQNVPDDPAAILNALRTIPARFPSSHHFGDGNSAERFMDCLRSDSLWKTRKQKQFCDLVDAPAPAKAPAADPLADTPLTANVERPEPAPNRFPAQRPPRVYKSAPSARVERKSGKKLQ
jgi:UDP-N-acetylglucosamine 2-epimerase (hydrolysing)